MKISDLKGIFKTSILTVDSVVNNYGDYYTVKMIPEKGLTWEPGEHGIFKLIDKKIKGRKWRVFSLASIPEEGFVMVGTRTGKEISNYKNELISMKKGDKISLRGPFGWFKVQDSTSPMVMVAGGVGITPIRAIIKQLEKDENRPVELVYAASEYHLFDEDIQEVIAKNKKIEIHKTFSSEETELVLANLVAKYNNKAFYFVSGSSSFISSIKKNIKVKGIKGKRIISDLFIGY